MIGLGDKTFRVRDPQWAYPIGEVLVLAPGEFEARERAAEAMVGCPLDRVDRVVADEFFFGLVVVLVSSEEIT